MNKCSCHYEQQRYYPTPIPFFSKTTSNTIVNVTILVLHMILTITISLPFLLVRSCVYHIYHIIDSNTSFSNICSQNYFALS